MEAVRNTNTKARGLIVQPISNTFTRDLPIDVQVREGIADWLAEDDRGFWAFGHSEAEARANYFALFAAKAVA